MKGRSFFAYLRLQQKRMLFHLPVIVGVTAVLAVVLVLFGISEIRSEQNGIAQQEISVGVVGDTEEKWVSFGLDALKTSRFVLNFIPMDEAEAQQQLLAGEITAYAVIPDGFSHGLIYGEVIPIHYVSATNASGFNAALSDEMIRLFSEMLSETENAVFTAQRYVAEQVPGKNPYEASDGIATVYLSTLLNRNALFRIELLGYASRLSLPEYYLCAILLLLIMLWAMAVSPLFFRQNHDLRRMLAAGGFKPWRQALAEYAAYVTLMFAVLALVALVCSVSGTLAESLNMDSEQISAIAWRFFLPALTFAALQLLLFELSREPVGALLLQFGTAVVLGFASGCFYPSDFLPDVLRKTGAVLPSGAAMRWLGQGEAGSALILIAYAVLFWLLFVLCRRRALERSEV